MSVGTVASVRGDASMYSRLESNVEQALIACSPKSLFLQVGHLAHQDDESLRSSREMILRARAAGRGQIGDAAQDMNWIYVLARLDIEISDRTAAGTSSDLFDHSIDESILSFTYID